MVFDEWKLFISLKTLLEIIRILWPHTWPVFYLVELHVVVHKVEGNKFTLERRKTKQFAKIA